MKTNQALQWMRKNYLHCFSNRCRVSKKVFTKMYRAASQSYLQIVIKLEIIKTQF